MKKSYYAILIIVVILTAVATYLLLINNTANKSATNTKNQAAQIQTQKAQKAAVEYQNIIKNTKDITLTQGGFEPKSITITKGTRVVWTNQSGGQGTVNSDPYPTNSFWKFLNLGIFDNGQNFSVTFDTTGTFTYHNQLKPSQTGTVVVK